MMKVKFLLPSTFFPMLGQDLLKGPFRRELRSMASRIAEEAPAVAEELFEAPGSAIPELEVQLEIRREGPALTYEDGVLSVNQVKLSEMDNTELLDHLQTAVKPTRSSSRSGPGR